VRPSAWLCGQGGGSPPAALTTDAVRGNRSQQLMGEGHPSDTDGVAADRLAERHFTMQCANTAELPSLEVVALGSLLRGLLFTDGTVTRALEAQTLCRVAVDVIEQSRTRLSVQAARYLDVAGAAECLRRQVTMRTTDSTPVVWAESSVWAESYILSEGLPTGFVGALDSAPQGIGQSIQRRKLESRRELLWFRLGRPPGWARTATLATTQPDVSFVFQTTRCDPT